jgi:hypothetical protein
VSRIATTLLIEEQLPSPNSEKTRLEIKSGLGKKSLAFLFPFRKNECTQNSIEA